ncbi:MAG: DUF2207 domain-containing protein [Actinomycetes bacterium]
MSREIRIKPILLAMLVVVLTVVGLLWPLVDVSSVASSTSDPVTVSQYVGDFTVAADGQLTATETLTAQFPGARHGIFRFFDTTDPNNPNIRRVPQITAVTRDGVVDPVELSWQGNGSILVARIGNPDAYVTPGSHTYVIAYTVPGVISPITAGADKTFPSTAGENAAVTPQSVFFWNVVAQGWQLPMKKVTAHVNLPSPAQQVQCVAGRPSSTGVGEPGPCTITGAGTTSITLESVAMPANTGMTVRAAMGPPPPTDQPGLITTPWPVSLRGVFGDSVPAFILVLLVSLIAFAGGLWWALRGKEREPGSPVMYSPPSGVGPAQAVYLTSLEVGRFALTATLLAMAEQKLVTLQSRGDKKWLVTSTATAEQWRASDPASKAVAEVLAISKGVGSSFLAQRKPSAGAVLQRARGGIQPAVIKWAKSTDIVRAAPAARWRRRAWVIALLAILLWLVAVVFFSATPSMYGLPFGAFAIGGLGLVKRDPGIRRTTTGRELWSRCAGFERFLSTDSAQDRFDFAANKDLFVTYIPYAVAFGVADKWAAKYRLYTDTEPPTPDWYPTGASSAAWYTDAGGFADLNTAISSSIGIYQATMYSSSSSDSGSSSSSSSSSDSSSGMGDGGGGGGGGSW